MTQMVKWSHKKKGKKVYKLHELLNWLHFYIEYSAQPGLKKPSPITLGLII